MKLTKLKKITKDKKKKGFTLVELIAVIAIIAVLAAALTPKLAGYINQSKKVAVLEQAREVVTAYNSVSLTNSKITEDSTVKDVAEASNGLISTADLNKIDSDCKVQSCINAVNGGTITLNADNKLESADAPVTPKAETPKEG